MLKEKKYFLTYEEYEEELLTAKDLAKRILEDEDLKNLESIVIGPFAATWDEVGSQPLIDEFIKNKEKLSHIKTFFIGDMDYEDCEVSWINQGNYEEFIKTFVNMEKLIIKGSNELILGNINHSKLKHLEIICGGLPTNVIDEIANANLPNLETLILYIGIDNYGFEEDAKYLEKLTKKALFPKLKTLGLVDSEEQDEITKIIIDSDILEQLEVLRLCYGTISDIGGQYIIDNIDKLKHLKKLDLEYNFLSDEMIEKLEKLPIEIDLSEQQENDEKYGNYPMLTE